MAAFHPRAEDLPAEFPVFPLTGALLLPRGKLPLNIFEPRYLAMTEDALGARPHVRHDPAGRRRHRASTPARGCSASAASGGCPRSARPTTDAT